MLRGNPERMLSQSKEKSKMKLESCLWDLNEPKPCSGIPAIINTSACSAVSTHALPANT